jgi:UTP-glucose-1-phosphate uridylyltransferase
MSNKVRKAVFPAAGLGTRFPSGDEGVAKGDAADRR